MNSVSTQISKYIGAATQISNIWGNLIINVKDTAYGAKGDGVTDDTAAIQSAINHANSVGKKEIYFPLGTYKYTTLTGTDGLTFIGDGVTLNGTTGLALTSVAALQTRVVNTAFPPAPYSPATGDNFAALLSSLIDYASANGKEIEIASGTYQMNQTIPLSIGTRIRGLGQVILQPAAGFTGTFFKNDTTLKDQIYIENIEIDGNSSNIGFDLLGVTRSTLKKVRVTGCSIGLLKQSTTADLYCSYNHYIECRFDHNDIGVKIYAAPDGWCNLNNFIHTNIDQNRINIQMIADSGGTNGQIIQNNFIGSELEGNTTEQAISASGRNISNHFKDCWFEPSFTTDGVITTDSPAGSEGCILTFTNCLSLDPISIKTYKGNLVAAKNNSRIIVDGEDINDIFTFYRNHSQTNLFDNFNLETTGRDVNNFPIISGIFFVANDQPDRWTDCGKVYQWAASTAFVAGDFIIPATPNGHIYKCTTAGTTGASEPIWNTAAGGTTSDNTAVWTEAGAGLTDDIGAIRVTTKNYAGVRPSITISTISETRKRKYGFVFYIRGDSRNTGGSDSTEGTLDGADTTTSSPPNTETYLRHFGTLTGVNPSDTSVAYSVYPSQSLTAFSTLYFKQIFAFEIYK